ncbi:serine protease grass-like [Condylostylus longicornis]|uniref:serine protease grass-like n=1 Tax=Condylostylus longicornis TaxID=2530218 RepID=UPI00244E4CE5|nr:serine protease grass-like [Condylostylus longicornis]
MRRIFQILINVLILTTSLKYTFAAIPITSCRTPDPENEIGWCVPTEQCKILDDIKDIPLEVFDFKYQTFIENSKCLSKIEERFCCAIDHINPEFASSNDLINKARIDDVEITESLQNSTSIKIPRIPNINREDILDIDTHPNLNLLPDDCGSTKDAKKVGHGNTTGLREFPFMVRLQYDRNMPAFRCGGTLINEKYILTAAHCVRGDLFSVRLGEYNAKMEIDCIPDENKEDGLDCNDRFQDIPIESKTVHDSFDKFQAVHDIALLRLIRPANMKKNNVKPICLPINSVLRNKNSKIGLLTGWGTTENGNVSDILLKALLYINAERQKCQDYYNKIHAVNVTDRIICAIGKEKEDSCKGDSGGPLFEYAQITIGETKKYLQIGIVGSGPQIKCGNSTENGGSLYINVARYMKWILDNIKP